MSDLSLEDINIVESGTYLVGRGFDNWYPKFSYDQPVFIVTKFDTRGEAMHVGGGGSGLAAGGDSGFGVRGWAPTGVLGWGEQFGVVGTLHRPADESPESRYPRGTPFPSVGCGVCGSVTGGFGVHGETFADVSAGVWGSNEARKGDYCYGVIGSVRSVKDNSLAPPLSGSAGVLGVSSDGWGVAGFSNKVAVAGYGDAAGVFGRGKTGVYGQAVQDHGVFGEANAPTKCGVLGNNPAGIGVGGLSQTGIGAIGGSIDGVGVYGITTRAIGVWAQTLAPRTRDTAWTLGLYAASPGAAAVFDGHVIVRGDLIVDQNHSLVVSTPGNTYGSVKFSDGSQRLVCAIESPEAWFEDFGEASLVKGKAHVALDPDFARTVDVRLYHVFLTPYGENAGLYVARRTRNGFDVAERKPGKSDLRFSWRVVARPKSAKHKRFAKTTIQQTVERVHAAVARAKKDPKIDAALPRLDDFRVRKAAKVLKVPKLPKSLMKVPSPDERRARMHAQLERARKAQRSATK